MKTKQVYYQDPYLKELDCRVISVEQKGNLTNIILDKTIFYPEGGGQPSDRGELISKTWAAKVKYVRLVNDEIIHQTEPDSEIKPGDNKAKLDWSWRYKYMRIHSAGHILHDVLMTLTDKLIPVGASHGKKAYLEYEGNLEPKVKENLEQKTNETISKRLPIITKEASYEELEKECQFLPPNLPRNKKLRIIKIGDYSGKPDGGLHVKNTKEIGKIWIANIISKESKVIIRYGIADVK